MALGDITYLSSGDTNGITGGGLNYFYPGSGNICHLTETKAIVINRSASNIIGARTCNVDSNGNISFGTRADLSITEDVRTNSETLHRLSDTTFLITCRYSASQSTLAGKIYFAVGTVSGDTISFSALQSIYGLYGGDVYDHNVVVLDDNKFAISYSTKHSTSSGLGKVRTKGFTFSGGTFTATADVVVYDYTGTSAYPVRNAKIDADKYVVLYYTTGTTVSKTKLATFTSSMSLGSEQPATTSFGAAFAAFLFGIGNNKIISERYLSAQRARRDIEVFSVDSNGALTQLGAYDYTNFPDAYNTTESWQSTTYYYGISQTSDPTIFAWCRYSTSTNKTEVGTFKVNPDNTITHYDIMTDAEISSFNWGDTYSVSLYNNSLLALQFRDSSAYIDAFSIDLSQPFNQEYTASGTISTTSNFAYELDLSSSYNFTGLLLVSDSTTYDGYINAEYTSSSSLSLSAVNDYSLGVEIVDYSSILITSSIESEVDRICETSGVITSSANFEYTDQPEFRFTFSGSIQTDSEIIEYYQDIGPVVVYHDNTYEFLPTETENSEYNHSYYVTVTPTKKVRIFTLDRTGPASLGSLWAQFIDIDPNTGELTVSIPVKKINAGSVWFTGLNTSHPAPQYLVKDADIGFVVFKIGDNRMVTLKVNTTTNQFSSLYTYPISNTIDVASSYTITDFEVINDTQFIAFYETNSTAVGTTRVRLATFTLQANDTFTAAYTLSMPEITNSANQVKAVKIRDDAFLTYNGLSLIYEWVIDTWVPTIVDTERYTNAYTIGENKVLADNITGGTYIINTSGNTIVSEVYASPLDLPTQYSSVDFVDDSEQTEGDAILDPYYFVLKETSTRHLMPNDTMQEEIQIVSRKKVIGGVLVSNIFPGSIASSYGGFGLFEYINDEDGIHNITPFDLSGPQSFVYTSNSFISTNVYSDHVFYPNFPALIEGIHLQTSGYVEIQRDFLFNMESSATLESGTVAFVEYIKEVSGTVTASSSTEYEEFNEYFSTIESNIIVSSVIETEQTYDYIPIINGNIFTSSIEEYYPETPRFADGQVLLSNHIDVYSDKFALANSTIQVSSTADYFYAGPLFLPELSGTIQLSGDFVYLINSFEDVASGEINVSSDFDISHKLDYVYSFSRTINISGDSSTQRGYEVNGDGVIYTDLFPEYEPGFEYDETGQIVIDGIATAEVYSKGYIYEGDVEAIVSSYSEFNNEYILTTQGEIHVLMDAVIDVDTYKYGVGGTIFVTSTSLYGWLADSKEVFRVIGLITKDVRCIGLMRKDIRVQGCISKDVPVYSRL